AVMVVMQEIGVSEAECVARSLSPIKKAVRFSKLRKTHIVLAGTIFAFNGSLGASLPSGSSSVIAEAFQISENDTRIVLLNSLHLVGFVVGPVFFDPLSECVGRRPVFIGTYLAYTCFTLGRALSPTFAALLVFRFLSGVSGSAPNAVLGGLYSDIYNKPNQRGRAMAIFMFTAINSQSESPIFTLKNIHSTVSMLLKEPIVSFTSLYLSVVYGVLFLFFQAYPLVFKGNVNGLAFIPMIFGAFLGLCLVLVYGLYHSKAIAAGQSWASVEEYRRLPLACVGAPLLVVALFWLGWTSYKSIHPALPMMAGIFFGCGYLLVFTAMLNYLTDAYKEFSASAQAAASATRAIMAVVLPFAAIPMYTNLGIHWASSLLGFLVFVLAWIPFAFIKYGSFIRQKNGIAVEPLG
ncbi:MFS general substrate transporter, partial [Penicillium cf. viridicatum]